MFANQNSATKLRDRFTLDQLTAEFGDSTKTQPLSDQKRPLVACAELT